MSDTIYDGPPSAAELERALVEVAKQRDQLLEGIEAHRAELAHGLTANHDFADKQLHALAGQVKSKGTGGDAVATSRRDDHRSAKSTDATRGGSDQVDGAAPDEILDQLPQPERVWVLEWAEEQAEASDTLHDYSVKSDDRDGLISHGAVGESFRAVIAQIRSLLSSEAEPEGGEG